MVGNEICTQLTKLFEVLDVRTVNDYEHKLHELTHSEGGIAETGMLITKLNEAFIRWENFLRSLDEDLEKILGPSGSALGPADDIRLGNKSLKQSNSTLLTYVKNSEYDMMFIEVVTSFSSPECAEQVLKMYERLHEFQVLNCDILLLTKGSTNGVEGGGFLKLVGVPFRMLLNEEEATMRILQHRQSAVSIAGIKAILMFTEIVCNDEAFNISHSHDDDEKSEKKLTNFGQAGGCVLVDRKGRILYNYVCTDNTDWPDVEILLEQVKTHKNSSNQDGSSEKIKNKDVDGNDDGATDKNTENDDTRVAVTKDKCCTIL
uniref:Uncharacterized protein n=1 Tax=Acrobeloides nanus TaxID=290746 RepID=A0A914DHC8_9BILA